MTPREPIRKGKRGYQHGFTLVELSVVLIIVALVTTMAASSGIAVVNTARFSATTKKMAAIDQALMAFRTANDRLPCPGDLTIAPGAANYGVEAGGGMSCTTGSGVGTGVCTGTLLGAVGTCAVGTPLTPAANNSAHGLTNTANTDAEGALPAATLGLPNDFMVDGWGGKFRYAVDTSMTANGAFSTLDAGCVNGAITVYDASGTSARSTGAIYALVSHGPNGHGAYVGTAMKNAGSQNANEQTNCHCSATAGGNTYAATYVQADPANSTAGNAQTAFDDLVSYKERWQMQIGTDPSGTSCFASGRTIYTADAGNNRLSLFNLKGSWLESVAGTASPCTNCACTGPSACPNASGSGNGQLHNDWGLAIDASGNIWVTDYANNRVVEYSAAGAYLSAFGSSGTANGQFNGPAGIAIDGSGNIWVADSGGNRVQKFNSTGTYQSQVGCASGACASGSGNGMFNLPQGLAIDAGSNLWVADTNNYRVQEFNSGGTWVRTLGGGASCSGCASTASCACSSGFQSTGFATPQYIAVDSIGNIWVTDAGNQQVAKYSSAGSWIISYANSLGQTYLVAPTGIAFDGSGNIWVGNGGSTGNMVNFTSAGSLIATYGSPGTGNGQFAGTGAPIAVAVGAR